MNERASGGRRIGEEIPVIGRLLVPQAHYQEILDSTFTATTQGPLNKASKALTDQTVYTAGTQS